MGCRVGSAAVLLSLSPQALSQIGSSGSFNLSDLDGSNGFVINGIGGNDFSGYSVSGAGDINGDGVDDVICLLYTSPSPRDQRGSRMPSSA